MFENEDNDDDESELLIFAAKTDDILLFEQAIDKGVNNEALNIAFCNAVASNSPRVAEALLVEGADANVEMPEGMMLIHHAIANHYHLDMLELILENIDDTDSEDGNGNTALHYGVNAGNLDVVESILEAGANPNAQNNYGETPLHDAFCKDNAAIVNLLLDYHADIKIKSHKNRTPIEYIYEYQGYGLKLAKREFEYLKIYGNG